MKMFLSILILTLPLLFLSACEGDEEGNSESTDASAASDADETDRSDDADESDDSDDADESDASDDADGSDSEVEEIDLSYDVCPIGNRIGGPDDLGLCVVCGQGEYCPPDTETPINCAAEGGFTTDATKPCTDWTQTECGTGESFKIPNLSNQDGICANAICSGVCTDNDSVCGTNCNDNYDTCEGSCTEPDENSTPREIDNFFDCEIYCDQERSDCSFDCGNNLASCLSECPAAD